MNFLKIFFVIFLVTGCGKEEDPANIIKSIHIETDPLAMSLTDCGMVTIVGLNADGLETSSVEWDIGIAISKMGGEGANWDKEPGKFYSDATCQTEIAYNGVTGWAQQITMAEKQPSRVSVYYKPIYTGTTSIRFTFYNEHDDIPSITQAVTVTE